MVEGSVTLTRRALDMLFLLIVLAVAALAIGPAGIVLVMLRPRRRPSSL